MTATTPKDTEILVIGTGGSPLLTHTAVGAAFAIAALSVFWGLGGFWRLGIDLSLGSALWRPVLLATHEIVGQASALAAGVAARKAA